MRPDRVGTAAALFVTGLGIITLSVGQWSTVAGWIAFGTTLCVVGTLYVLIPESWEK